MIIVLQMGMTDNLGGIETYLINYYRNIDKNKIQFDFTNIYPNDLCFQDEIIKLGGKVYIVSSYYKHPIKYIKEIVKIIKDNNYDIVHCNMNSAAMLYPLIAAKIAGAKIIIAHSHNNSSDKGFIKSLLHNINKHFIPLFANQYWGCSEEACKWFYSKKIMRKRLYKVINNAIDIDKFKFSEENRIKIRNELKIENDDFVVGHVGRFSPQKNHLFLIDVFYDIYKQNKNAKLILIGVGQLQNKVKDKVNCLGLSNNVLFLNNRNDVNEVMAAMDVFLLPSIYEGLGIVLVEAQACGLPCITTTNIPNIVELSRDFKRISLLEDSNIWADSVISFKNMNRKSMDKKVYEFDIFKCTKILENYYEYMINN